MSFISVVLPAYNEADRIESTVTILRNHLLELDMPFEIIIAEDGSQDGTDIIADYLAEKYTEVIHLHSDERLGRGKALNRAFSKARGDILVYMDVDLSTSLDHLKELISAINEGYDIVTGSRRLKESISTRPLRRDFASSVYNFLVRLFLKSRLKDHQCGFKAFKKEAIMEILPEVKDDHWFWDTEVLVRAQYKGFRVKEIPVKWEQAPETKVNILKDALEMGSQILRLWFERKKERRRRDIIVSIALAAVILLGMSFFIGVGNLGKVLASADLRFILLASLVYLYSWHIRGLRYRYIFRNIGYDPGIVFHTGTIVISQTVNIITPARIGDLARAYIFKRLKNIPVTSSISALAVERIYDTTAIMVIAVIAMIGFRISLPSWISSAIIYSFLALLGAILVISLFSSHGSIIGNIMREIKTTASHRETFFFGFGTSLGIWCVDILVCFIVLSAIAGLDFSLLPLVALGVTVANLTKIIPITPGGIGTYELALSAIMSLILLPEIAFSTALIDHLLKNLITLLLGGVFFVIFHLRPSEVLRGSE
jgi:hypothetical protein